MRVKNSNELVKLLVERELCTSYTDRNGQLQIATSAFFSLMTNEDTFEIWIKDRYTKNLDQIRKTLEEKLSDVENVIVSRNLMPTIMIA